MAVVLVILLRRWAQATAPQRRALAPVLWSGVAMLVLLGTAARLRRRGHLAPDRRARHARPDRLRVRPLGVPDRPRAQPRGARRRGARSCCMRLGEAPGTGTLRLPARRRARRPLARSSCSGSRTRRKWVDSEGHKVELPARRRPAAGVDARSSSRGAASARSSTTSRCARTPSCCARWPPPPGLAMENERLQAQLRARVEELRTSRARIVEAGTHERRRLERNLHDGAQQRLVALSLTLRLAQAKLRKDPDSADRAAHRRPGGADARARRAARAGARHPPGDPVRPRARRRPRGARRARADRRRAGRDARPSRCRRRSRPPPTSSSPRR